MSSTVRIEMPRQLPSAIWEMTGFPEHEFNREDWNAKATVIGDMGDDSTRLDYRQEVGDDAQRAPGA
jgi:hypothetical protein